MLCGARSHARGPPAPQDRHWLERWELAVDDIMRELVLHAGEGNGSVTFVGEKHGSRPTEYILPHLT